MSKIFDDRVQTAVRMGFHTFWTLTFKYFRMKNNVSYFELVCSYLCSKITKYKYVLLGTYITAFLTYTFSFVHKLPNNDDIHYDNIRGVLGIDHGRWMMDVIKMIMPHYSMPWIYGILSILIFSVAFCYIIKIFKIDNKYFQFILAGLMTSFSAIVGTLAFMFLSYMYAISLLFSVISVYLFLNSNCKCKLFAIIPMVLSMGIYQAYWSVAVSFLFLLTIVDIFDNKKPIKILLKDAIFSLAFICGSAILYYLINTAVFSIFDVQFNWYASERVNSDWPYTERLYWTIMNMISCVFFGTYGFVVTWLSKIIHWILFLYIIVLLVSPIVKKKQYSRALVIFILLCFSPIVINSINIISPTGTHTLTLFSFVSIYILVTNLTQRNHHKWIYDSTLIFLSLLLFNNILMANKVYLKQFVQYENAKSFYTGLVVQIEQTPGFDASSKLALIGKAESFVNDMSDFRKDGIFGIEDESIVNLYSRDVFISKYVGFTIPFATTKEIEQLKNSQEFSSMATYPFQGSIKKIGNIIVVKFSDNND